MEICFVAKTKVASQYPGVFIFTDMARMIRPVKNLTTKTIEYIGTFEQVRIVMLLSHHRRVSISIFILFF